jgi:hypothetical protein
MSASPGAFLKDRHQTSRNGIFPLRHQAMTSSTSSQLIPADVGITWCIPQGSASDITKRHLSGVK